MRRLRRATDWEINHQDRFPFADRGAVLELQHVYEEANLESDYVIAAPVLSPCSIVLPSPAPVITRSVYTIDEGERMVIKRKT
jgi:hypothetical protein